MKAIQLIIFGFVGMGVSCQKDDKFTNCAWSNGTKTQTKVSGKIVTRGTNDYPGQGQKTLLLLQREVVSSAFLGGSKYVTEDSLYSDIGGNFSISFNAQDPCDQYRLRPLTEYSLHFRGPVIGIPIGKESMESIKYTPHAWLQLHVKNSNPQLGDQLNISWGGGDRDNFFGPFNDTIIKLRSGNLNNPITSFFYRDNIKHDIFDTVYLPAFDTTYHLIDINM